MTDQRLLSEQLDRFFGSKEEKPEARSGLDLARVLEARIVQLERQQQVFEEEHRRIVAQYLETSDALLMTEQRSALARLEQEVVDRTRAWRERTVILEQAKAASEAEKLAVQQRLLTLAYAADAQTKVILEATVILDRDVHTVKGHEALESIRSSAAALLSIVDTCCGRDVRRIAGEDACGTGEHGDDAATACQGDGSQGDSGCPFDRDVALARAGGDAALLQELVTLFLTDGPKHLLEVKVALTRGDGPALSRAAHTLKGAAGLFGAVAVTRAASEMEGLRRVGDLAQAERVCADLEAAYTRMLSALTAFVREG